MASPPLQKHEASPSSPPPRIRTLSMRIGRIIRSCTQAHVLFLDIFLRARKCSPPLLHAVAPSRVIIFSTASRSPAAAAAAATASTHATTTTSTTAVAAAAASFATPLVLNILMRMGLFATPLLLRLIAASRRAGEPVSQRSCACRIPLHSVSHRVSSHRVTSSRRSTPRCRML